MSHRITVCFIFTEHCSVNFVIRAHTEQMRLLWHLMKPRHACAVSVCSLSQFSSAPLVHFPQSLSHVWVFATPWTAARQASLSFIISWSLLRLLSVELVMPSNHLVLCHPLLLPSISPSIRDFSNESALRIRWPKYWSFSISPSSEYSGLISFRIDWFDLLSVQETLKSLLQHHSSKAVLHEWTCMCMY